MVIDTSSMNVKLPGFAEELETLINKYSVENDSNTPDFLLAEYLIGCLAAYSVTCLKRDTWYGVSLKPGQV